MHQRQPGLAGLTVARAVSKNRGDFRAQLRQVIFSDSDFNTRIDLWGVRMVKIAVPEYHLAVRQFPYMLGV